MPNPLRKPALGALAAAALAWVGPRVSASAAESQEEPGAARIRGELSEFTTPYGRTYHRVPVAEDDFVLGPASASFTVVVFGDFANPYSRVFAARIGPLRQKYADRVRWVFKHLPASSDCSERGRGASNPPSCDAARAANCAGEQGKFWPMHDRLFALPALEVGALRAQAAAVGVDLAAWDDCYRRAGPDRRILSHLEQARAAGVVQSPTTFIDGHLVPGAPTPREMERLLRAALEHPWQPAPPPPLPPAGTMVEARTAGGRFYVDAYEASLDGRGHARSDPDTWPARLNWIHAQSACRRAGKRLCSEEEWISACTGEPARDDDGDGRFHDDELEGRAYPYGYFYLAGVCHDAEPAGAGKRRRSGSMPMCRTPGGIYDLSGNLAEWTGSDRKSAAVIGGDFRQGRGATCQATQYPLMRPRDGTGVTGFRCCADEPPGAPPQEQRDGQ